MAVTRIPHGLLVLAALFLAVYAAQQLPGQQRLREMCLLAYPVLAVWLTACVALWRWPAPRTAPQPFRVAERTAA
jgi:hypothetical protein